MKCVNHPEIEAAGVCVVCGKPFCASCIQIQDNRYICEKHMAETQPARRGEFSPGWILVANLLPGLGYLFMGLYQKALTVFLIWMGLIFVNNHTEDEFTLAIMALIVYSAVDGFRTARALNAGQVPQETLQALKGKGRMAIGILLVAIGFLAFFSSMTEIDFEPIVRVLFPMVLIGLGAWLLFTHFRKKLPGEEPPPEPPIGS